MIVVTGAAGFIASALVSKLNSEGFNNIVLVDDFSFEEKNMNLEGKNYVDRVERESFFDWLDSNGNRVEFIFHLGARTNTAEFDHSLLTKLNIDYSKMVWKYCIKYQIPLVYASSAATYGDGNNGYKDDINALGNLEPLNPYGWSKNEFDKWVIDQKEQPFFWAGLKFFNVYGPNEYHKGRMASVVYHTFNQVKHTGEMKLFKSHNSSYQHGEQLRDFVYVKDVVEVCFFLMNHRKNSSIYNLGSGEARTFLDLAKATFNGMGVDENISFIDIPEDIRDKYQYYTQADMSKLRSIGYNKEFTPLEDGVSDYVKNYLVQNKYY